MTNYFINIGRQNRLIDGKIESKPIVHYRPEGEIKLRSAWFNSDAEAVEFAWSCTGDFRKAEIEYFLATAWCTR